MDDRIISDEALELLLSSDPSIVYQTRKYLLEEDENTLRELQKQTLIEGFGRRFCPIRMTTSLSEKATMWANGQVPITPSLIFAIWRFLETRQKLGFLPETSH